MGAVESGIGLGPLCVSVGAAALVVVPLAFVGGVLATRFGEVRDRWSHVFLSVLGRVPTLLTAAILGSLWLGLGNEESLAMWGVVAMVAGLPVIWRIVARALGELPSGLLESASCLGMSRLRVLRLVGMPVIGPVLAGAALIGFARAVMVAWVIGVLSFQGRTLLPLPWDLVSIVVAVTLMGTLLLAVSRSCLHSLERGSGS